MNKVNKKDFVRAAMRRSGLNRTGFCMRHDCSRKDDLGRPNNCCPAASPCKLAPGATHHLGRTTQGKERKKTANGNSGALGALGVQSLTAHPGPGS